MASTGDDARKKRDCAEAVEDNQTPIEENTKKPRAKKSSSSRDESPNTKEVKDSRTKDDSSSPSPPSKDTTTISKEHRTSGPNEGGVWDLESALHYVVRMGGGAKEFLSKDEWVSFRAGDTGDVSALASFYRKSVRKRNSSTNKPKKEDKAISAVPDDDTPLEVHLADGLGDEDTPPSVFALLADIKSGDGEPARSRLGAAALFTLAWEDSLRTLRVEWMHVDRASNAADVLERRLWLRLSTICLLTSCEMVIVKEKKLSPRVGDQKT